MVARKFQKYRYIVAFILTAFIFLLGMLVGQQISESRLGKFAEIQEDIKIRLLDNEIQNFLLKKNICNLTFGGLEKELQELSIKLGSMESQLGKYNQDVVRQKKPYLLLVMKQYFLLKERKEECSETYNLILFFYSNKPEFLKTSEDQGTILSYLREKYPGKIKVFAMDVDLGLESINMLRQLYKIEKLPSLVINDKTYEGFYETEKLIDILGLK